MHRTEYTYGTAMSDGFTVARLLPRNTPLQTVRHAAIDVSPIPDEWEESLDPFGNRVVHFAVHHPHFSLTVVSHAEVGLDTTPQPRCRVGRRRGRDRLPRRGRGARGRWRRGGSSP